MEVTELRFKTTARQAKRLELLAGLTGISVKEALRAVVYLGVEQALEKRAEESEDLLNVHMIDKILATEQAGAVDTSNDTAMADLMKKHETIIGDLNQD